MRIHRAAIEKKTAKGALRLPRPAPRLLQERKTPLSMARDLGDLRLPEDRAHDGIGRWSRRRVPVYRADLEH
jgi:hypothetical protein